LVELDIDGQLSAFGTRIGRLHKPLHRQFLLHGEVPLRNISGAVCVEDGDDVLSDESLQTETAAGRLIQAVGERVAQSLGRREAAIERTDESGGREEALTAQTAARVVAGPW